jgi:hypothetical protein
MFAAAVLVVMILAIIAPATGHLPSHTGQAGREGYKITLARPWPPAGRMGSKPLIVQANQVAVIGHLRKKDTYDCYVIGIRV